MRPDRRAWRPLLLGLCLLTTVCSGQERRVEVPEELRGSWRIDPAASFALLGTKPQLADASEEDKQRLAWQLAQLATHTRLTLGDASMAIHFGDRVQRADLQALPIVFGVQNEWRFEATEGDRRAVLVMRLREDGKLTLESTAMADLADLIWQRAPATADSAR